MGSESANKTREYGDLVFTLTSSYHAVWNDRGSGATRNGAFWHPNIQGELRPLGDIAVGSFDSPEGKRAALLVGAKPGTLASDKPPVASPTDYKWIWDDRSSGAKANGSVWRPIPPNGYVAMGDVARDGWDKPSTDKIWCLREDLIAYGRYEEKSVWDDTRSGGEFSVSVWNIIPTSVGVNGSEMIPIIAGTFKASQSLSDEPDLGYAIVPVLKVPKDYKKFDSPVPSISADELPEAGTSYPRQEQCRVELPFTAFFPATDRESLAKIKDPFCTVTRSMAWYVDAVYVNNSEGTVARTKSIRTGISKEDSASMTHSAGISITSSAGVSVEGVFSAGISITLNYQFTYSNTITFTEFQEHTVTETFTVPPYNAIVLFAKHIWITGKRSDGSVSTGQVDFNANDDLRLSGIELKRN